MDTIGVNCPDCGETEFTVSNIVDNFQYGSGADAVELSAAIPVHTCNSCGFQFTDSDAEVIRHEAVCNHLGRMSPAKIRELRDSQDLSREAFAAISGIGYASLSRWESGHLIQGAANDNFLYLLQSRENMERLTARIPEFADETTRAPQASSLESIFVCIKAKTESLQIRQKHFDLHPLH